MSGFHVTASDVCTCDTGKPWVKSLTSGHQATEVSALKVICGNRPSGK